MPIKYEMSNHYGDTFYLCAKMREGSYALGNIYDNYDEIWYSNIWKLIYNDFYKIWNSNNVKDW